jgi:REP-associated tyrosine transposase
VSPSLIRVRPPREQIPGATYHVTSRGNRRQPIYEDDDDRVLFLKLLRDVVFTHKWIFHFYCLMTTHYHLVFSTPAPDLAVGMHRLNGIYARCFNRRHGHSGHVFERRYHSVLVKRDSHFMGLCRYVALNPVRAGLCTSALDWPWSSYRAAVGAARCPDFVSLAAIHRGFAQDERAARRLLRLFVEPSTNLKGAWHP